MTPALIRVLAGLLLIGLALRTQILVVGPIIEEIQADLAISHGVAGLLGSIPVLCMGLLAPFGPVLAASLGPRLAAAICVILVGGFGVLRASLPDAFLVLTATVGIGVGMALIGPILPMVVRGRAASHPAAGTGAYVAGLIIGGSIAAALAVPLSEALGGWRSAFAVTSAAAFLSVVAWWVLIPPDRDHLRTRPALPSLPWRRPSAWLLGLVFGSQATLFYGSITWLAAAYMERGWSAADAAGLVAFFNTVGLFASLSVPLFADRWGTGRQQLTATALVSVVGAVVIAMTPGEGPGSFLAFGGVAILAIGIGIFFPLSLTLPVDVARDSAETASIAALMLLVGYAISAAAPLVLGLVRDAAGDFEAVLWILVGMAAAMVPLALAVDERRLKRAAA